MSPRPRPLPFLLPLTLFLWLTLYQLGLPGPNYDEAVEAKPAVQLLRGQTVEAHRHAILTLAGKRLPLMIVDYVGALNTYALLVYFKLGGISVPTMRLWPITVGVAILWLTYRLGARAAGERAGLLAALLLAVQPSNVFFTRQGIYVTNTTIAFSLGILLALVQLTQMGQGRWWWLAAFLTGLGLWAKFIMLWPLIATAILAPIVWLWRQPLGIKIADDFHPRDLLRPTVLAGAFGAFLLGLAPLLLFNLQTGATIRHFVDTLGHSYYGVANTDYATNLISRWYQLSDYLRGDHFWYLGGNFRDTLALPAWLAGLGIIVAVLLWPRRDPHQRPLALRALFFYAFTTLLLFQSPLTPTALWYTHLAMFSPYLALGTAIAWELLFRHISQRWATAAAIVFALALGLSSVRADLNYHRALAISGGYADHSDAAYRLADYLRAEGVTHPYALDWGFQAPLLLISQGDVQPIETFGYENVAAPPPGYADLLRPLLQDPNAVFLVHATDRTNFPGRNEVLTQVAAGMGMKLEIAAAIRERSGVLHSVALRPVRE